MRSPLDQPCASPGCSSAGVFAVGNSPVCRAHFVPACYALLEDYSTRLKRARTGAEPFPDAIAHDLASISGQILDITLGTAAITNLEKAQFLDITFQATALLHGIRRSPRRPAAIPVRLLCTDSANPWAEETVTQIISPCGALVRSTHRVQTADRLLLCRIADEVQVHVRVAWSRTRPDGAFDVGLEILNCPAFWSPEL